LIRGWRILFITYAATNWLQQPANTPVDPVRRDDTYAIYSELMSNLQLRRSVRSGIYLIAPTTMPGGGQFPGCVNMPPEYQSRWSEVLEDYGQRQYTSETLEPALKITSPYLLLTEAEAKELTANLDRITKKPQDPKFQSATELLHFGNVYFSRDRTLALTAIDLHCGSLCGTGGWRVFEKGPDGRWTLVSARGGATCGDWVS